MRIQPYIAEAFLGQLAIYLIIWLNNDYLATMLSLVFGGICFAILIISLIVDWVEYSGVPKWYYQLLVTSVLAPIIGFGLYLVLNQGLDWMNL
jgi:hypothetical protein